MFRDMKCPECGEKAWYEVIDVGTGLMQVSPATCSCDWVQGCSHDEYLKHIGEAADNV
jgi:hypothetical protein